MPHIDPMISHETWPWRPEYILISTIYYISYDNYTSVLWNLNHILYIYIHTHIYMYMHIIMSLYVIYIYYWNTSFTFHFMGASKESSTPCRPWLRVTKHKRLRGTELHKVGPVGKSDDHRWVGHSPNYIYIFIQGGAAKIAKLVYISNNYGL